MDQRVLVTAGASGIGLEIARAFAAQGATVFVCDIDAEALENLKQEIPGVVTKVCDVSKRGDIGQMIAFGVDALGGLDVLVSNAGIASSSSRLSPTTTLPTARIRCSSGRAIGHAPSPDSRAR